MSSSLVLRMLALMLLLRRSGATNAANATKEFFNGVFRKDKPQAQSEQQKPAASDIKDTEVQVNVA